MIDEKDIAEEESRESSETDENNVTDEQAEFSEQYRNLPLWKQAVLLILFLGVMTAVIMLINFIVEFGAELIKALTNV